MSLSLCRSVALALLSALSLPTGASAASTDVYSAIKAQEANFPVPTPSATLSMGTFDVATGQFTGKVSTLVWTPPSELDPKPRQVRQPPVETVNAVSVHLVFTAVNRPSGQGLQVTANNTGAFAFADTVTVDVGNASSVQWRVTVGSKSYSDSLVIKRPPIVGAGAFTIPALPLVVIYAPPVDQAGRNRVEYATTQSTGTTIGMSFSREESTARPTTPSRFSNIGDMKQAMGLVATVIKKASSVVPNAAAIAAGFEAIAGALGEASANREVGTRVVNETTLEVTDKVRDTYYSVPGKGPGLGDVIVYLRNAQLVWLAQDGQVTLALLGQESVDNPSVGDLLSDLRESDPARRRTGLDTATIRSLLRLDPFVDLGGRRGPEVAPPILRLVPVRPGLGSSGPVTLPASRYDLEVTYGVFQDRSHEFTHTVQQTDLAATTDFTLLTESFRKGFLSFLGMGVSESATVKTHVTQGSSRQVTTGTEVRQQVAFHAQPGESYSVEV